jgi:hypothetical protein
MGLEDPNYEPRLRLFEPTPDPQEEATLVGQAEELSLAIARGDLSSLEGTMRIVNMVRRADEEARADVMRFFERRL